MITDVVKGIIAEVIGHGDPNEISTSMDFEDDLQMDEDDLVEVLEALEVEFDIDLVNIDYSQFKKVKHLITYLKEIL
ncbi:MAG: acyl carrier protein [Firmicutes bacterium HGW-Firmicutes-2]|jgi:acyl carrier protein|nr:MAG: acyl carrier protein [Firmicutes bacterium HGW-Firmicutes-2]